jgi:hypothetical protein
MRQRFVPSYYARGMLNKVQCLQQGSKSVEEYFQELQIGMLRFGLVENDDAAMTRVFGGRNHKIQDVLDYKEYNNITRLFHLACKAEREVQERQTRSQAIFSAGRTTSWKPGSAFTTAPQFDLIAFHNKQAAYGCSYNNTSSLYSSKCFSSWDNIEFFCCFIWMHKRYPIPPLQGIWSCDA